MVGHVAMFHIDHIDTLEETIYAGNMRNMDSWKGFPLLSAVAGCNVHIDNDPVR
jgi:hypothetical protein